MTDYVGTIKSFNEHKGWGHIACEQTFAIYGKDMFLLRSELNGQTVKVDNEVKFNVRMGLKGPEAYNLKVRQVPIAAARPAYGGKGGACTTARDFVGTIKSFNEERGWGHIACDATFEMYGKDMFLLRSELNGQNVRADDKVSFSVKMGLKGPEAHEVRVWRSAHSAAMPRQQFSPNFGQSFGQSFGQHFGPPFGQPFGQQFGQPFGHNFGQRPGQNFIPMAIQGGASQASQTFVGVIKSFNEEKGWGHISCQQTHNMYGKDMFLLRSELNGQVAKPDEQVSFKVRMGQKGPEAYNVMMIGNASEQEFVGEVKIWNQEKGWGFITCKDTESIYQKDIFMHKKDLDGYVPTPGEPVGFMVSISDAGRPEATSLQFGISAEAAEPAEEDDADPSSYGAVKGGAHAGARASPYV